VPSGCSQKHPASRFACDEKRQPHDNLEIANRGLLDSWGACERLGTPKGILQVADVDHESALHDVGLEGRGFLQHSANLELGRAALFHSALGVAAAFGSKVSLLEMTLGKRPARAGFQVRSKRMALFSSENSMST